MKAVTLALLLLGSIAGSTVFAEPLWQAADIDSQAVDAAAQTALEKLGPERGAVTLVAGFNGGETYNVDLGNGGIDIIGLTSDTSGIPLDLQGLISDLDADVTDFGYKISLSGDVLFEFNKADLKSEAKETLQKVVLLAKKENAVEIRVEGHTDSEGGEAYNQELSLRRAESVKNWLNTVGDIQADIIKSIGLGETQPVAENKKPDGTDNPEGRAQNRRVDIYVKKRGK
jgi:outer membrane protein OmpA-like peptidoglycan-associated protein